MELFLGALAWCAGMSLLTVSSLCISQANPREKLPFIGHPARTSGRALILLLFSIPMLIAFFVTWSGAVGNNWALAAYCLALIPTGMIVVRHNRGVRG